MGFGDDVVFSVESVVADSQIDTQWKYHMSALYEGCSIFSASVVGDSQ